MNNGQMWYDDDGNAIQAHGGCIIKVGSKFFWYGENKGIDNVPGERRVYAIGISCYSSENLVDWYNEGIVLKADENDPESRLYYKNIIERPKVIYCEKTNKFVMWFHLDDSNYAFARAGLAISDSPTGPFEFVGSFRPNRHYVQDITVFKDRDNTAYLIHATEGDYSLCISRLTDDYLNLDGHFKIILTEQEREAPAVCVHNGVYYMVTSGCTGWEPNNALFAISSGIDNQWKLIDNPCEGENYRKTFFGQSSYIFCEEGNYYLMLDHWLPDDLKNSGYSILPIEFNDDRTMTVKWREHWNGIPFKRA